MNTLCHFIKILPQKRGIDKNLGVKKFIKKVEYSKEIIAISLYYRENPGEEITANDASGWVGAATGKENNLCDLRGAPVNKYRYDSFGDMDWLPSSDSLQTIEIVLPNCIHGCRRKNLKLLH
ncbi:MAG: hypothetical protein ACYDIA_04960 [Candidatus Humimicrobiaceae bacterium]